MVGFVPAEEPQTGRPLADYPEWADFPGGIDFEDEADILRWRRWVDEGEAKYGVLMAAVRECNDRFLVGQALAMLRESQGDKRAVVSELKELVADWLPRTDRCDEDILIDMAEALADMGTEEDVMVLAPMLTHPLWRVRVIGARCLGRRGGFAALEALKQVQGQSLDRTEREAIDEAVSNIEKRLFGTGNAASSANDGEPHSTNSEQKGADPLPLSPSREISVFP